MNESRYTGHVEDELRRNPSKGAGHYGGSSKGSTSGAKRGIFQSYGVKSGVEMPSSGFDPHIFPSSKKTIKGMLSKEGMKKVGKAVSKFFIFNALPFNAADSGPYMQSMIDTIAEVGPGVKGPYGYQIGGIYLNEEVEELENINTLRVKWPIFGCTIMCAGWSSRTRHPIINFMIYCDRNMIYHSSVDCTNKEKNINFIFGLMDRVVEEIGEQNVVQVITDNESSFRAAGEILMQKIKHLFWSPCEAHCIDLMLEDIGKMKSVKATIDEAKRITSFIYNSDKIVNLMKIYTKDRELLRPVITRFATEYIALESFIRHQMELRQLCTCDEWRTFNNTAKWRNEAIRVSEIVLT
ncbi:UNVERIFIED_CONTAM: hypothetical protein Slati_0440000 [Sesamum latifolium]|uniref:DUF659 domain-containing protein n=1 Tax=Sesamum latifolium TaxID=2727402 RepID=A0AAW2XVH6_9LAMI